MANLNHPDNLKYSKTDEWVRVEGDQAIIGITDYAQDQLGDIVYIELPWESGQRIAHEQKLGTLNQSRQHLNLFLLLQVRLSRLTKNSRIIPNTLMMILMTKAGCWP